MKTSMLFFLFLCYTLGGISRHNLASPSVISKTIVRRATGQDKLVEFNFQKELTELYGSVTFRAENMESNRPAWASVWPVINAEYNFGIYFWPPKYCHAIYLCPVEKNIYDGLKKFDQFSCDDSYIKYYPHISKLLFKKNVSTPESSHIYVESSLQFERLNQNESMGIRVLRTMPVGHFEWKETRGNASILLKWDLIGKDLLILTNSRMCEVVKPGADFYMPFSHEFLDAKVKALLPNWLTYGIGNVPTAALPATGNGDRKVDLLEYLKSLSLKPNIFGKAKQKCANYESIGVSSVSKPVFERSAFVSVASYDIFRPTVTAPNGFRLTLEFSLNGCQWIRFWATDKNISFYPTDVRPEDTFDLFLSDGFYMTPDSNEAKPLPDIQLIERIKMTVMRNLTQQTDDHELIEFGFGNIGDEYLFHQYFKSISFGKRTTKLHLIRSPNCESNYVLAAGYSSDIANLRRVKSCVFSYLI